MALGEGSVRHQAARREPGAALRASATRVLLLEDVAADAELALRELKRAGLEIEQRIVKSEAEFRTVLAEFRPEVVLSDFSMPGFDGMTALRIARELSPDTPFIFVSGTLGEEYAIRALQQGATDYVLKSNLARLPVAVERALQEVRARAAKQEAERALRESELGLRRAQAIAGLAHIVTAPDGSVESWSENLPALLGLLPSGMPASAREWLDLAHPEDRARLRELSIEAGRQWARRAFEYRLRHKDGSWVHVLHVGEPIGKPGADGRSRWFGTIQDVTAQKQMAATLEASEARYRTTFEQAAVGIVHSSLEGELLMVNQAFAAMTGYSRAEAILLHIRDLTHPEDFARSAEVRASILSGTGKPYQRELRLMRKDRSPLWASVSTALVRGAEGKPLHFVSVVQDVSERRRAEAALRESEKNYRSLFEANPHPMWMYDPETLRFVAVNDAAVARYGYSRDEFLSMTIADIRPQAEAERLLASGAVRARGGVTASGIWTHRKKDGSLIDVEITSHLSELAGRRVKVVLAHDVTERKRAEAEVERFRLAMDVTVDSIYLTDPETMRFFYVNDSACRRLGYTREALLQKTSNEVVGKTREQVKREYDEVIAAGERGTSVESEYVRSDGSRGWTELHRRALRTGGKWIIVTIGRDITERKLAEIGVRESEARFRSLTELSSDWYWEQDAEFRFTSFSGGEGAWKWGADQGNQIGRRRWEMQGIVPLSTSWEEHRAVLDARQPFRDFEYMRVGSGGERRYVSASGEAVFDAEGRFTGYRGTARDITDKVAAQNALREAEQRYRSIFENSAEGLYRVSLRGALIAANPAMARLFGYESPEEIVACVTDLSKIYVDLTDRKRIWDGLNSEGVVRAFETRLLRKDASTMWASVSVRLVKDANGAPSHVEGAIQDITERKKTEEELRESEARFRSMSALSSDWFWQTDTEHRFVDTPARVTALTGMGANIYVGKARWEIPGLEPTSGDWSAHRHVLERRESYRDLELVQAKADGTRVYLQVSGEPIYDAVGKFAGYRGTAKDITPAKQVEEDLRRFRLAMDSSADIIIITDRATMRHLDVNETACRLLGYTREQLLAMGPHDILPVSREELEAKYDELIANPELPSGMRSDYRCKDGSRLPFESTRKLLRAGDRWIVVAISRDIRERLAAESARREAEERFRSIFENAAEGIYQTSASGRVTACNPAAARMFGFDSPEEVLATITSQALHPYVDRADLDKLLAALEADGVVHGFETRFRRRDGSIMWASISPRLIRDDRGKFSHVLGMIQDITERKLQEKKIERLSRMHTVLSAINAAIVRMRDRDKLLQEACRIAVQHGGFGIAQMLHYEPATYEIRPVASAGIDPDIVKPAVVRPGAETISPRGTTIQAIRARKPVYCNDITADPALGTIRRAAVEQGYGSILSLPILVGGEVSEVLLLCAREKDFFNAAELQLLEELAGDVGFALDHIAKEEKLNYLALYDPLTGLANRALLAERLGQQIHDAGQAGVKFAIVSLDLERLTTINESLGRQVGDALLRQVAERLRRHAGPNAVARIMADQFVVVLPTVKGRSEAGRVAANGARACFAEPYRVEGNELKLAAKAGLALFPNDGVDAETLLANAEAALRKAKETGERQLFYTPDLTERTGATLTLENKLRRALENDEFVLHYQPKFDTESRRIAGLEALIRWQSPELGLVPPGRFIPLMEETGMILDVGAWALQRASLHYRRWTEAGLKPPRVAVNVSAIQLRQRDFVQAVEEAILEGVAPTGIDLEITESLVMEDIEANIEKLKAARALGVGVAIDDFGTGYSSLAYLAKLPVQTLKIDRSFVISMLNDPDTMTLVQTIISLAHAMRLKVVAEGVDAEEQAKVLRLLRCDELQGYLLSKPLPHAEITALLEQKPQAQAGSR
ncbi:MAG: PAS domain S-box protein [Pseudomonadota bacterium]